MLKPTEDKLLIDTPKVFTGIQLDTDVLEILYAAGSGWQARMNDALREWVKELQSNSNAVRTQLFSDCKAVSCGKLKKNPGRLPAYRGFFS